MWLSMMALADVEPTAAAEHVDEEVVVWARPFARFDDTRWVVRSEVITPSQIQVGTPNHRIRVRAWQIEVIVHCRVDDQGRLREADCVIEDAAVRVHNANPRSKDEHAVRAMAKSMKGASVSLQVNAKGRVPNLGVDGMPVNNFESRQIADGARVMLRQLAAAFHMEMPKGNPMGTDWQVEREPLLEIPAVRVGLASVKAVHRIDVLDGHWVQQTHGRSTSTVGAPNPTAGMPCFTNDGNPRCPKIPPTIDPGEVAPPPTLFDAPDSMGRPVFPEEPDTLDVALAFVNELNAVSVIDPDKGYATERVWSVRGKASASSTSSGYWAAGSLRQLDPAEEVTLGASGMVGTPGKAAGGAPAWVSFAQ